MHDVKILVHPVSTNCTSTASGALSPEVTGRFIPFAASVFPSREMVIDHFYTTQVTQVGKMTGKPGILKIYALSEKVKYLELIGFFKSAASTF